MPMIFRRIDSVIKIISPCPRRAKHIADAVPASRLAAALDVPSSPRQLRHY
jgi:hypothetical protein